MEIVSQMCLLISIPTHPTPYKWSPIFQPLGPTLQPLCFNHCFNPCLIDLCSSGLGHIDVYICDLFCLYAHQRDTCLDKPAHMKKCFQCRTFKCFSKLRLMGSLFKLTNRLIMSSMPLYCHASWLLFGNHLGPTRYVFMPTHKLHFFL